MNKEDIIKCFLDCKGEGNGFQLTLTNEAIDVIANEIERLKKREQECIDHYLVQCKYASEIEEKYISANYIINELEKEIKWQRKICLSLNNYGVSVCDILLNKLEELKGDDK